MAARFGWAAGIIYGMVELNRSEPRQIAAEVVRKLQAAGFEAYFAGGCVRDQIMGNTPEDYDIATSAHPEQVLKIFPRSKRVGAAFGVVMVRHYNRPMEVATFRTDGVYSDGRRPDTVHFTTAEHDAQRRDFTCNGLFFDPMAEKLIDYVGGQVDINARILRAIGEPAHRFREDHLRMMRAIRFAARLNFAIEPATWTAIVTHANRLAEISRERIGLELRKMLVAPQRHSAVEMLARSGLLQCFWPEIAALDEVDTKLSRLAALPQKASFPLALAATVLDLIEDHTHDAQALIGQTKALQTNLVLSSEETQWLQWLLLNLPMMAQWRTLRLAAFKRLLAHIWSADLLALYATERRDDELRELTQYITELKKKPLAPDRFVDGSDLIAMGVKPGPRFKLWLEELYDRQLEGNFIDRPSALKAAKELIHGR